MGKVIWTCHGWGALTRDSRVLGWRDKRSKGEQWLVQRLGESGRSCFPLTVVGEGDGNPLQYSCWELQGQRSLAGHSPRGCRVRHHWATNTFTFPGRSTVKCKRCGFRSLGWEDPTETEMATRCSLLPGKPRGRRGLAGYSPQGRERLGHWTRTRGTNLLDLPQRIPQNGRQKQ